MKRDEEEGMKKNHWHIKLICCLFWICCVSQIAAAGDFTLTSPQLKEGALLSMEQVFNSFGCTGKNISPELNWNNPPQGTKSFAVTVYDPDAPTGSGWWHWVVFNIPAQVMALASGSGDLSTKLAPAGSVQSMTDFGKPGYGGACPPQGDKPHRYIFSVYALDIESLPLEQSSTAAMVGFYIHQHVIGKARLTVTFSR